MAGAYGLPLIATTKRTTSTTTRPAASINSHGKSSLRRMAGSHDIAANVSPLFVVLSLVDFFPSFVMSCVAIRTFLFVEIGGTLLVAFT